MAKMNFAAGEKMKLMTLDPGHFHAALVQKFMYPQVDKTVHVYAPDSDDVTLHMGRINGFNTRTNPPPTNWESKVYRGSDFFERMIAERPGNVVVLAGNNAKKSEYILKCAEAGLHVFADKPMAINAQGFETLKRAFAVAEKNGTLIYDIMTERSEITTILMAELSRSKELYGEQIKGDAANPGVWMKSVHFFFKEVAGSVLRRPQWYFDVRQQGEGIVDVTTHLVDLTFWQLFPGATLAAGDVAVTGARRWPTAITEENFCRISGANSFPDFLCGAVDKDGVLQCYANGEIKFTVRGVHSHIIAIWDYAAVAGSKDSHDAFMRGTRAKLEIRQGAVQNWKPVLYVVKTDASIPDEKFEDALACAIAGQQAAWPGVSFKKQGAEWVIVVPEKYDNGHEMHFAQVTERFIEYLAAGKLPDWEIPNILAKYATTTQALGLSHAG